MNSASTEVDNQPHGSDKHYAMARLAQIRVLACPDAAPLEMLEKNKAGQIAM
jgi:hypothetical protein